MWSLPSPLAQTASFCCPPDCSAVAGEGYLAWRAPLPDAFAHRIELTEPPPDLPAAFSLWDAVQGHTAAEQRILWWETPLRVPFPSILPRYAPYHLLGMSVRGGLPPPSAPLPIQEVEEVELLDAVALAAAREQPGFGDPHVALFRWQYQGLQRLGARTFAALDGGSPVAAVTLASRGGLGRLRELWTARTHRRRGIARALICTALRGFVGDCRLLTERGSPAHQLYRSLEFRPVSRIVQVSSGREGTNSVAVVATELETADNSNEGASPHRSSGPSFSCNGGNAGG